MKENVILLTMKKIIGIIFTALVSLYALSSCKTVPTQVPYEATELEIVQLAQNAFDAGNYNLAIEHYNTLIQRYGMDTSVYIEGRFEIAHIYLKQKKYSLAAPILQEILELYDSHAPGELPGSYRKLAQADYAKIPADKIPDSAQ